MGSSEQMTILQRQGRGFKRELNLLPKKDSRGGGMIFASGVLLVGCFAVVFLKAVEIWLRGWEFLGNKLATHPHFGR